MERMLSEMKGMLDGQKKQTGELDTMHRVEQTIEAEHWPNGIFQGFAEDLFIAAKRTAPDLQVSELDADVLASHMAGIEHSDFEPFRKFYSARDMADLITENRARLTEIFSGETAQSTEEFEASKSLHVLFLDAKKRSDATLSSARKTALSFLKPPASAVLDMTPLTASPTTEEVEAVFTHLQSLEGFNQLSETDMATLRESLRHEPEFFNALFIKGDIVVTVEQISTLKKALERLKMEMSHSGDLRGLMGRDDPHAQFKAIVNIILTPAETSADGEGEEKTLDDLLKSLSGDFFDGKKGSSNKDGKSDGQTPPPPPGAGPPNSNLAAPAILGLILVTLAVSYNKSTEVDYISFQEFQKRYLAQGLVGRLVVRNKEVAMVYGKTSDPNVPAIASFRIGSVDHFEKMLEATERFLGFKDDSKVPVLYSNATSFVEVLIRVSPMILLVGAIVMLGRGARGGAGGQGGPGGMFSLGKSNAKKFEKQSVMTSFKDVAGCDEAKAEVMEFVEFLKNPERFEKLGAKVPKGALLVGPPGTGKTLLAKATAGEASVPFYSVSGSDFIEMFVGVGPARVRDLFAQARTNAPCILFIDEIDAVGRARGRGGFRSGGNDERENTLNQILVEMDGMDTKSGVVVLAGTNRADVLDKALVRAGRFDRQISIDLPDMRARKDVFMVHLKPLKLKLAVEDYAPRLAQLTPGFSGADIANVCNEAALVAARYGAKEVHWKQFEQAIDRVIAGLERKTRILSPDEKKTVAYHEAGHAVAGWFLEHTDPLLKVSIVPRGAGTLGFAQYLPGDQNLYTRTQLEHKIMMALGGRVSEELNFGRITTGASDDLDRVTKMAYGTVVSYGMGDMGPLSYHLAQEGDQVIGKPYSEDTASKIDDEVMKIIRTCYDQTKTLLQSKMTEIDALAKLLIEKEVINREEVESILGARPFVTDYSHEWAERKD